MSASVSDGRHTIGRIGGHLDKILSDLQASGIKPSALNVLGRATDEGFPDAVAAEIAKQFELRRELPR